MKKTIFIFVVLTAFILPFAAFAQSLDQLVLQLQEKPDDAALREQIIKLAQEEKPAIPEEARRAFVQGVTIAKDAKDAGGQKLAVQSFKDALKIAPWWGDAYYNLAVAQELAGNLDDATSSLEFYIMTGPGDKEVREAQDRIYALEAKEKLAQNEKAAKAEKAAQEKAKQEAAAIKEEAGRWNSNWSATTSNSQYGAGYPYDLQSEKKGNVIEFINPVLGPQTRVALRGTMDSSGNISWEMNQGSCGMKPMNVSVSADYNTVQYSVNTIDDSSCQYYSDVNTFTYTRK